MPDFPAVEILGVTRPAVMGLIHGERPPASENGGRFWVRRDLLEQVEAARLAGDQFDHAWQVGQQQVESELDDNTGP